MATIQEAIKRLRYIFTTEGEGSVVAGQAAVTAKIQETEKASLSLEKSFASMERRYNTQVRAQQDFAKVQREVNAAVQQNPALQQRANAVLAMAAQHFDQVSNGQRAFQTAMRAANDNLRSFASAAGPTGAVLSAMGTGGIAAAIGIGAVVIAIHSLISSSTGIAEWSGRLRELSETTSFAVIELQALFKTGSKVGIDVESVSKSLERFSVQMAEVHLRTGATYEKLLALNPELAREMANATSLRGAYELLAKAIKGADLERANQLARAFFGREGVQQTRLLRAVADADGIGPLVDKMSKLSTITTEQAERWDTLGKAISANMRAAHNTLALIFAEDVLTWMERFSKNFLELSREVRQFGINEDLKKFMDFMSNKVAQGALAGGLAGFMAGGPVGAVAGAGGGAFLGFGVQQQDAKDTHELTEQLDKLTAARKRAADSVDYYQRMVFSEDNPNQANDIKLLNEKVAILGRIDQRITDLKAKLGGQPLRIHVEVPLGVGPDGADRAAENAAKAQEKLRRETIASYNEMARWMGVIGAAATLAEHYEMETKKLAAAKAEGKINEEQYTRAIIDQREKLELSLGVRDMSAETEKRLAQVREVSAKAGLTDEQTRLAVSIAQREAQERAIHAWERANPALAQVARAGETAFSGITADIASGTIGIDQMINRLGALGNSLTQVGSKSLFDTLKGGMSGNGFNFDPMSLGVGAIGLGITALSSWIGGQKKAADELQKNKLHWMEISDEVRNFNAAADGFDLSQFVSAIQQITKSGLDLIKAAMAAGDTAAAVQLIVSGARQINNQVDQFIKPKGNTTADQVANENAQAKQLIDELNDLNAKYHLGLNRTNDILAGAAEHIAEIQRKAQEEIEKRGQTFQDRLFAATNDNNTLAGQLAAFDRQAIRDTIAERDAGGQKLIDLEAAQAAERFNIIKSNNDKIVAADQAAAKAQLDALNGAAKNVVDFLASLQSGPNATVSPIANYTNSRSLFNANDALALGGNIDATNKWASLADNFLKASGAVNASGQAFQDDLQMIISRGLALPAVQQTTDPVVIAIRDSITAIQAVTAGIDLVRTALNTGFGTGNLATIAGVLLANLPAIDTNTSQSIDLNEMISALGPSGGNVLTSAQLDALQLARNATVGGLLTQSQIDALGLSKEQGNVLKVFQTLDADGDNQISKLDLIRAQTEISANRSLPIETNTGATANLTARDLDVSFHIDTSATRIVSAINAQGKLAADVGADHSKKLADIAQFTLFTAAGGKAGSTSGGSGGAFSWFGFDRGGYTGNLGTSQVAGVVHGREFVFDAAATRAIGLDALNFANENRRLPTTVVPFAPRGNAGGDNAALIAEVRELRRELAEVKATISGSGARGAQASAEAGEKMASALSGGAEKIAGALRHNDRKAKVS